MTGIVNLLFHPAANAIMTILAGLSALYWVFTFLAGDFFGHMDFGVDFDTDVDLDAGVDVDGGGEHSAFEKVMQYINVGKVPFMVVLSVFKFIAWIGTLVSSVALNTFSWGWKSALLLIPVFIITFFLTRLATRPLVKIYRQMGYNGEEAHDFLGRTAVMRAAISGTKIGNAELRINTDLIRINVQSKDGASIAYNQDVTIVDEIKARNIYIVEAEINLNNI
ncbi:MAG: DUF1449 family protein [Sphingobacteriales bacterium]|nr:MAG: DUF1449 family protein [Sphingobacteriales bacterium]